MARRRSSRRELHPSLLPPAASFSGIHTALLLSAFLLLQGMVVLFGGTRFWASGPFLVLLFLVLIPGMGLLFVRAKSNPGRLSVPLEVWTLAGLAGYAALRAVVDSPVPIESWSEATLLLTAAVIWGVFAYLGATSRSAWMWVCVGMVAFAMLHSFAALRSHLAEERMVLWLSRPEHYGMRASGTFICPNHFGHYLQMAVILGLGILFMPRIRWSLRIFIGYALLMIGPALALTLSRAALLGTLGGVGVVLLLSPLRKRIALLAGVVAGGVILTVGAAVVLVKTSEAVQERMRDFGTRNIRWSMIWPDTVSMIREEGFWGSGPGTYLYVFDQYREKFTASNLYLEYAHNEFLHILAEYGWIPFLGILFLVGVILVRDTKGALQAENFRSGMLPAMSLGLVVATLIQAVFDFHLHITANALVMAMILGTLHGAAAVRGVRPGRMLSADASRRCLAGISLVSLLLLIPTVRLTAGSTFSALGKRALERKDTSAASAHFARQRVWLPGQYDGWRALGLEKRKAAFWMRDEAQKRQLIEESRAAYERALQANPYDRISLAGKIELLKMEQRWEEALQQLDHLITLAPHDVQVRIQKGLTLKRMNLNEEALAVFQEAKRMRHGPDRQIDLNIRTLRRRIAEGEK